MHAMDVPATPEEAFASLKAGSLKWGSVFTSKMLLMSWDVNTGWSDPSIQPYGPLHLPPSSSIFHYGMEVFEGMKAFRASAKIRLFRPDLNIARMNASATRLSLPTIPSAMLLTLIKNFVYEVRDWVPDASLGSLYVRPAIIATDPKIGVRRSDSALLFIIACPVGSFFDIRQGALLDGVRLKADPKFVRAWPGGVGFCKTGGNYAVSIYPAEQAKRDGYDQILWLSDSDRRLVTEVGMMNVFFVYCTSNGRKIVTPRLDGTILDGVTRRSVLQLAEGMGVETEERDICIDEVFEGIRGGRIVEVFGTGTAAVVCPVWSIACDAEVAAVKRKEENGDLSVVFRDRLMKIQSGAEDHPWMIDVERGELVIEGDCTGVETAG